MMINMIWITLICVIVTDISDFPSSVKKAISYALTKGKIVKDDYRLHWVDCSFCQVFWLGLAYILYIGEFSLMNIALILACSFLTTFVKSFIQMVEDVLLKIIQIVYKILDLI